MHCSIDEGRFFSEGDGTFSFIVHFLFDDTAIAERYEELIGFVYLNENEANSMRDFIVCIDSFVLAHDPKSGFEEVIKTNEWRQVVQAAKTALKESGSNLH